MTDFVDSVRLDSGIARNELPIADPEVEPSLIRVRSIRRTPCERDHYLVFLGVVVLVRKAANRSSYIRANHGTVAVAP